MKRQEIPTQEKKFSNFIIKQQFWFWYIGLIGTFWMLISFVPSRNPDLPVICFAINIISFGLLTFGQSYGQSYMSVSSALLIFNFSALLGLIVLLGFTNILSTYGGSQWNIFILIIGVIFYLFYALCHLAILSKRTLSKTS